MKKCFIILIVFLAISCQKKEVQLPQVQRSVVTEVFDHSPIYMFFETKDKDTLIDVNRKNSITSTSWIFNIDKRLPLRLVIPEIIKLQAKKASSSHANPDSQNWFSYSDSIQKKLAFVPFTKVEFKLEKPKSGKNIYFSNNEIKIDTVQFTKVDFEKYFENLTVEDVNKHNFCFNKDTNYGVFVKDFVFINGLEVKKLQDIFWIY